MEAQKRRKARDRRASKGRKVGGTSRRGVSQNMRSYLFVCHDGERRTPRHSASLSFVIAVEIQGAGEARELHGTRAPGGREPAPTALQRAVSGLPRAMT